MVNGNDVVEHIERCDSCMALQEQIDELDKVKDEIKVRELNKQIEDCFVNTEFARD
jgi:hypothetical protein